MADVASDFETVMQSAKAHAPDRYAAALFAPRNARADLIAIAAFTGEIDRIVRTATDVALGEIRLQWWRDGVAAAGDKSQSGNPVLDAFLDTARRRALPLRDIDGYLEARANDLAGDAPSDFDEFAGHLRTVDGVPIKLAALAIGLSREAVPDELVDVAARACGWDRLARELPYFLARGRSPLPASLASEDGGSTEVWRRAVAELERQAKMALNELRARYPRLQGDLRPAVLPLALIEPHFRALQRGGHDPTRDLVEIAPLARLWYLSRASMSGRF